MWRNCASRSGWSSPSSVLRFALQAVALLAQQLRDLHVTDRVLLPGQLRGQSPRAFANPAQRRLRIAARFRIDQAVQRDQQMGIVGDDFLSSSPWSPDASGRRRRPLFDFPQALGDGLARQAAGATNLRDAAIAQGAGFAGGISRRVRSSRSAQTEANFCWSCVEVLMPHHDSSSAPTCYLYLLTPPNGRQVGNEAV